MKLRILAVALVHGSFPVGLLTAARVAAAEPAPAGTSVAAYERLKTLVGEWKGTLEWTGARTGLGPIAVRYHLTGNGTAVVEDLETDGVVAMTSVYHMDGQDLRLTHYCGANNQPRLRASFVDESASLMRFSFVDITNLKTKDSGHVNAVELRLHSPDKITLTFTFVGGGGESYERIELMRVAEQGGASTGRALSPAQTSSFAAETPAMAVTGAFFALSVADARASAKWYAEKLGMRVVMETPKQDGATATVLEGGGLIVELIQPDGAVSLGKAAPGVESAILLHGLVKAGVMVADFDKTLATLKQRGVPLAFGPYPAKANQRANVIIRDNSGNLIQFFGP